MDFSSNWKLSCQEYTGLCSIQFTFYEYSSFMLVIKHNRIHQNSHLQGTNPEQVASLPVHSFASPAVRNTLIKIVLTILLKTLQNHCQEYTAKKHSNCIGITHIISPWLWFLRFSIFLILTIHSYIKFSTHNYILFSLKRASWITELSSPPLYR